MLESVFDINNFNVISDEENYYFFRALNMADNNDIEKGITTDTNGQIKRIRTDRERYEGIPKYDKSSKMSLEQIFDHIKIHYLKETNCISLSSNANAVITYGRGYYKDKYVMIKVPKKELGEKVVVAGSYILNEINKKIDEYISNNELDSVILELLNRIDFAKTSEELNNLIPLEMLERDELFKKGIIYKTFDSKTREYQALNYKQNLEKNKIVAKLNIINQNIIPTVTNRFLVSTLGNAFSSLELTHYNDIEKEEIIEVDKKIVDMFSVLQQLPNGYSKEAKELKEKILSYLKENPKKQFTEFEFAKYKLDEITIDDMYELTKGEISYNQASKIYQKSFYLAKSKLRTQNTAIGINEITGNDPKYHGVLNYLCKTCYGIEPEIILRQNQKGYQISESVNLDISTREKELLDKINNLKVSEIKYILNNPVETLGKYLKELSYVDEIMDSKERYYANAIIDLFDWSKLDVVSFSHEQRNDIVKKLVEHKCLDIYTKLKKQGVQEKDIANAILTTLIKGKDTNNIDLNDTFTVSHLETFLGYYQIKDSELQLRDYQVMALNSANEIWKHNKYASVILPTGAGKSYVALSKMLDYRDKKILYLSPNNEILDQLRKTTKKTLHGKTVTKNDKDIMKSVFPKTTLTTYQMLLEENGKSIIEQQYDLIVIDEAHRALAKEWFKKMNDLIDNQNENVKVLGITATPQRDADLINASDELAKKFGYTEEEVKDQKHTAINMDLITAIEAGYVIKPKIIPCEYTIKKDGSLVKILEKINNVMDEGIKKECLESFEKLRRNLDKADGIPKILNDNLKQGGKYIVFLPISKKENGTYTDDEENQISKKQAERIIQAYQNQMKQYMFSGKYYETVKEELEKINKKILNEADLTIEEIEYLTKEKTNILLLSTIKNIKENDRMITEQNDIADNIISKMNWDRLEETKKGELLNQKTKQYISNYSMLGTYGKIKNKIELNKFNEDESDKIKFMYVMNKLNEGTHIDGINGLIWFRALDENSKILFLQQFGRIIFGLDPLKEYTEEERTIAIDLVNNSLRVLMDKEGREKYKSDDLALLQTILLWSQTHSYKIPDVNSLDSQESRYGSILKRIQTKYLKYINDNELLKELEEKEKDCVNKVLSLGNDLDLWNIRIPEKIKSDNSKQKEIDINADFFGITGIEKDVYELWKKLENTSLKLSFEEKIKEIYEISKGDKNRIPSKRSNVRFSDDSAAIGQWIQINKDKIIELVKTNEYARLIAESKGWLVLSMEDRLKEIYEISCGDKNKVPSANIDVKFSDGSSKIGNWILRNKDKIIELIEINEYARFIAESKGWLDLSIEDKLKEIYEISGGDKEKIPVQANDIRFSDGSSKIGNWIQSNKDKIIELVKTNECARIIAESKGWFDLSFEDKLKEIYKISCGDKNKIPSKKSDIRFSDGSAKIGKWIQSNKDKIIELVKTNECARLIAKSKGWLDLSFEDKLKEIYEISGGDKNKVPVPKSDARFSDDSSVIGSWINQNRNKIIELVETNEYARVIAKSKGWYGLSFEEKLKEIYELSEGDKNKIPSHKSDARFSDDSSVIGTWIFQYKDKIIELIETNEYARFIAESKGWLNLSFEERLKEIYEISEGAKQKVPGQRNDIKFSDGSTKIGNWIARNKDKIIESAKTNECARLIAESKGWLNLSFEERLKEIYEISEGTKEKVPVHTNDIRFSDGSAKIGHWIAWNKDKIIELAKTNEYARLIAESKGWFGLSFEDRLKEIYEISGGDKNKIPKITGNEIRFSDERVKIGYWIQINKDKIIELAKTNEYARFIAESKGWFDLSFEERLKEIYEISEGDKEKVPVRANDIRFSDGSTKIGYWIDRNKDKFIELAKTNEYARFITESKSWLNLSFEERLKEIYEISEGAKEKVPVQTNDIRFSDGSTKIGHWIAWNKDKIIELIETNEYARFIAESKGWLNLSFEERLKEIYEMSEGDKEKVPVQTNDIRFSDRSTKIGHWIARNKDKIIGSAKTNEYARFIAESKGWILQDLSIDEIDSKDELLSDNSKVYKKIIKK